jgi:hypothetical protein
MLLLLLWLRFFREWMAATGRMNGTVARVRSIKFKLWVLLFMESKRTMRKTIGKR